MSDDDDAVYGESEGRVPCLEQASAQPAADDDTEAISGADEGRVPAGTLAASELADDDDDEAVAGHSVGFVPPPCGCDALTVVYRPAMDANVINGKCWVIERIYVDPTPPTIVIDVPFTFDPLNLVVETTTRVSATDVDKQLSAGNHVTASDQVTKGREYVAFQAPTTALYGRLIGKLRGDADPNGFDWTIVSGDWGTGTPVWDEPGTVIASGTALGSVADWSVDLDVLFTLPPPDLSGHPWAQLYLTYTKTDFVTRTLSEYTAVGKQDFNDLALHPVDGDTDWKIVFYECDTPA